MSNAPRITLADIEANIVAENYINAGEAAEALGQPIHERMLLITFCCLVLRNGFIVTGESACVSPENFDAEIGRQAARENAVSKVWSLMGYELRSRLAGEV